MPSERQQLLSQLGTTLAGIHDVLQHTLHTHRVLAVQCQLGRTHDDSEQVVEIMRQPTRQLAQRLELLRLEQLGTDGVQLQR
ncbi:hypothetical protein D3C80_1884550 [compost metagenome]